jgi:predicted transglutaminase-like cysteine proteinase
MKHLIAILVAALLAGCATNDADTSQGVPTGEPVQAPYGWPEFCERYPSECEDPQ